MTYIYTVSLNVMRNLLIESIKGMQNKQVTIVIITQALLVWLFSGRPQSRAFA